MTDERDEYTRRYRQLAGDDDLAPALERSIAMAKWAKRVRELLSRKASEAKPLRVTPKRVSGPQPHVVPDDWHTADGQQRLAVTLGPRCRECREPVFAEQATLIGPRGLCGRCAQHEQGGPTAA